MINHEAIDKLQKHFIQWVRRQELLLFIPAILGSSTTSNKGRKKNKFYIEITPNKFTHF